MDPDTRLFSTRVEADPDSVPKATQGQAHGRGHRSRKEASSPGHNSSGPILPAAEARGNLNTTSRGQRWLQKYSGKGTDNGWGGLFSLGSLSPTPSGAWMAFPTPHASLAPGEPPNSAPAGYLCPPMPPPSHSPCPSTSHAVLSQLGPHQPQTSGTSASAWLCPLWGGLTSVPSWQGPWGPACLPPDPKSVLHKCGPWGQSPQISPAETGPESVLKGKRSGGPLCASVS